MCNAQLVYWGCCDHIKSTQNPFPILITMANGFCNSSHEGSNFAQHPPHNNTSQNPCTLCNRVFPSTQALITHVDSHIEHEEGAIRRFYSHQNINDGWFFQSQPSPPQPMAMTPQPRRNPFFSPGSQVGSSPSVIRQMQLPPQLHVLSPARIHQSQYDGTKAYITQLEKPIKKIDFIDLVNIDDDDDSEAQPLDLTLKL